MTDFAVQRQNMVESQVRPNGITDARVIDAMAAVPRELFVPEERRALAYMDEDVLVAVTPDGGRRWLMEPMTFARLLQLAEIGPGEVVLDVGCATGYSTAVIAALAESVIAVEEDQVLAEEATARLGELGITNAAVVNAPHGHDPARLEGIDDLARRVIEHAGDQELQRPAAQLVGQVEIDLRAAARQLMEQPAVVDKFGRSRGGNRPHRQRRGSTVTSLVSVSARRSLGYTMSMAARKCSRPSASLVSSQARAAVHSGTNGDSSAHRRRWRKGRPARNGSRRVRENCGIRSGAGRALPALAALSRAKSSPAWCDERVSGLAETIRKPLE
jgi:hypothetical protein